jgi:hypothetical protein
MAVEQIDDLALEFLFHGNLSKVIPLIG